MVKRTYKSILKAFEELNKDKLNTSDFRKYFEKNKKMKRDSVYQTLSRALKDLVLRKDEYGFYSIVDKSTDN